MAKTDLGTGINSFYVVQLLARKEGSGERFGIFRRWGRVGDDLKSGQVLKDYPSVFSDDSI